MLRKRTETRLCPLWHLWHLWHFWHFWHLWHFCPSTPSNKKTPAYSESHLGCKPSRIWGNSPDTTPPNMDLPKSAFPSFCLYSRYTPPILWVYSRQTCRSPKIQKRPVHIWGLTLHKSQVSPSIIQKDLTGFRGTLPGLRHRLHLPDKDQAPRIKPVRSGRYFNIWNRLL